MFLQCQGLPSVNLLAPVFKVHQRRVDIRAWRKVDKASLCACTAEGERDGTLFERVSSQLLTAVAVQACGAAVVRPSLDEQRRH